MEGRDLRFEILAATILFPFQGALAE